MNHTVKRQNLRHNVAGMHKIESMTARMQNDIVGDTAPMARFSRLVKQMAMPCKSLRASPEK
jgi:hypothetical protein